MNTIESLHTPIAKLWGDYDLQAGDFGVEIECEGVRLPEDIPGWKAVKDGSLRGEAYEYITDRAVTEAELATRMRRLELALVESRGRVNEDSFRCSTHVHVNMQHNSVHHAVGAAVVFTCIEPIFMALCGPNRDGNLFCIPSYDCGDIGMYWVQVFNQWDDTGGFITRLHERGKYASLNLNPLGTLGTIEFRAFPCSVQKDKVLEWVRWCAAVKAKAVNSKADAFISEVDEAYNNPFAYLEAIFGKELTTQIMKDYGMFNTHRLIQMGCAAAYEIARPYAVFQRKYRQKVA